MADRRRVAVLISGSGSNLQALIEATAHPASSAKIVLVISNRGDAFGLVRAQKAGIATAFFDHRRQGDRHAFEAAIQERLEREQIDIVCLAGFMRILSDAFVSAWWDRLLNIHPSLLPAYRGLHTHERALADGVRVSGCTVHIVRPELDAGPILVQGVVPVLEGDSPERLASRILEVEHRCYPKALELLASGRAQVIEDQVRIDDERPAERLVLHPLLYDAGAERADGTTSGL